MKGTRLPPSHCDFGGFVYFFGVFLAGESPAAQGQGICGTTVSTRSAAFARRGGRSSLSRDLSLQRRAAVHQSQSSSQPRGPFLPPTAGRGQSHAAEERSVQGKAKGASAALNSVPSAVQDLHLFLNSLISTSFQTAFYVCGQGGEPWYWGKVGRFWTPCCQAPHKHM